MEGVELAKRKALETVVATLCVESGYQSAERDAIGLLSQMIQSCES